MHVFNLRKIVAKQLVTNEKCNKIVKVRTLK